MPDCVSRSPMCWLMKTFLPTLKATVFFRCAPTASTHGSGLRQMHRQRRIATCAAQHHLAPASSRARSSRRRGGRSGGRARGRGPRCRASAQRLVARRCRSARRQDCRSSPRSGSRARASADDAAACKAASRRDMGSRGDSDAEADADSRFLTSQSTIGDSGESSRRSSSSETSQSLCAPSRAMDTSTRTAFPRVLSDCVAARRRPYRCAHPRRAGNRRVL